MDRRKLLLLLTLALVNSSLQSSENLNVRTSLGSSLESLKFRSSKKLVNVKDYGAQGDGISYDNKVCNKKTTTCMANFFFFLFGGFFRRSLRPGRRFAHQLHRQPC